MKKFLSLVLALVMTMSLVTVSAGAKDFSDDDSITYQEAVDVISEIGVVDGYTGGDFKPTDVLTRGAAAKIICNLILGPTTASALSASSAPFKDVPVSNTFAGYITYCAQEKHHQRLLRRHLPSHRYPERQRVHEDAAGRPGL